MVETESPGVVHVTERRTKEVRLSPVDAEYLCAEHRRHVQMVPSGRPDHYLLTPRSWVGVIGAPSVRLIIHAKVSAEILRLFIDPNYVGGQKADDSDSESVPEPLDFLALTLADLMSQQAARGLCRQYQEHICAGPYFQGRLDLPTQLRASRPSMDRIHCIRDDLTADIACNRIPKSTAELLLTSPAISDSTRLALMRSLQYFHAVSGTDLNEEGIESELHSVPMGRISPSYATLLRLCRILLAALHAQQAGSSSRSTALVNMDQLFEHYVGACVDLAFLGTGNFCVLRQKSVRAAHSPTRPGGLRIRPDVTVECAGQPRLVLDSKWKDIDSRGFARADIYQIISYGASLDLGRVALVHPGERHRVQRLRLVGTPMSLSIFTLRVAGALEECRRSAERFARELIRLAARQDCNIARGSKQKSSD